MSKLREQLDAARGEYHAVKYPGDLAGEVLPPARSWRRVLFTGGGFAIGSLATAATIVLCLSRFAPAAGGPGADGGFVMRVADEHLPELPLPPVPDIRQRLAHEVKTYEQYLPAGVTKELRQLFRSSTPAEGDEQHQPA